LLLSYELEIVLIDAVKKERSPETVLFALAGIREILSKEGEEGRKRFELVGGLDALEQVQLCPVTEV